MTMTSMIIMQWMRAPQPKNSIQFSSDDIVKKFPDQSYTKGTLIDDLIKIYDCLFF
jgi:hypothetical protein